MKRTLVLLLTYRGATEETKVSIENLQRAGARSWGLKGTADVALGRSWLFSDALRVSEGTDIDTFLCVDDDMVFSVDDAEALVAASRESGDLVSGIYGTSKASAALTKWNSGRWLTGMGFLAVPVARMREKQAALPVLADNNPPVTAWAQSGLHPAYGGRWTCEDYWFCLHWDGVLVAPVGVGHLKTIAIWPDDESIAGIVAGGDTVPTKRVQSVALRPFTETLASPPKG